MTASAEHRFVCELANGLHARPASVLAEAAGGFTSEVLIIRDDGLSADVRSVLSVVGLNVQRGDAFTIRAHGDDAVDAIAALRSIMELGLVDDEAAPLAGLSCKLPPALRMMGVAYTPGLGVGGGSAIGRAVNVGGLELPIEARHAVPAGVEEELRRARDATQGLARELKQRAEGAFDVMEASLLGAHAQIAGDTALWSAVESRVRKGDTAERAIVGAAEEMAARLRSVDSAYVRERAVDVIDIAMQLVDRLIPGVLSGVCPVLESDSIVFADTLTANQLLSLDRRHLRGLVLGAVGQTSHTVIIARNIGLPCIIDVAAAAGIAAADTVAAVDGDGGFVISPVDDRVHRFYEAEQRVRIRKRERVRPIVCRPAATADGVPLEVGVTAVDADEVRDSVANGADGVGLFRTEFLYLHRDEPPGEDEQRAVYVDVIEAASDRPVILRTFDTGGDKPAPYLRLSREDNPFLGVRGVRLHQRRPDLLDAQLRAMVSAADGRPIKVMAPMVSTVAEMAWFRQRVRALSGSVLVGMMVEVPSLALSIDRIAPHADFFSIGTNDLCQYWMAADRGNTGVARIGDELQPAFLRVLRRICDDARTAGVWTGVCGEMGGRVENLPLMIGLGVDEVSAGPAGVAPIKLAVAEADSGRCRSLLDAACELDSADEVRELVSGFAWRAVHDGPPIIDAACIELGVDATSKAEAIKAVVDLLAITGRTDSPRDVEEAAWAREETYSTGLGHGIAIPHCKCASVKWPTLAVVTLSRPVEWDATDGQPVGTVFLLAVPEGEAAGGGGSAHLKIFATLARRLVHEAFRQGFSACRDAAQAEAFLRDQLAV
ncbi:MAG: phosphoenolpyruvate--protein phosphotransferase [Phycisphaerales bacterium]|jgi:phosphoenolpyruvate-protein phosphotransferase